MTSMKLELILAAAVLVGCSAVKTGQSNFPEAPLKTGNIQTVRTCIIAWNAVPDTTGVSYNIREWVPGYSTTNQWEWPVRTNVNTTSLTFVADSTVLRCVTATNRLTGIESCVGISPVSQVFLE